MNLRDVLITITAKAKLTSDAELANCALTMGGFLKDTVGLKLDVWDKLDVPDLEKLIENDTYYPYLTVQESLKLMLNCKYGRRASRLTSDSLDI